MFTILFSSLYEFLIGSPGKKHGENVLDIEVQSSNHQLILCLDFMRKTQKVLIAFNKTGK